MKLNIDFTRLEVARETIAGNLALKIFKAAFMKCLLKQNILTLKSTKNSRVGVLYPRS